MSKTKRLTGACALLALGVSTAAPAAGTIRHNEGVQGQSLPRRGVTMNAVRHRYGKPVRHQPAVGQPPITRWDYADFVVYFERNRVVDTVVPGHPPPLYHRSQLERGNPVKTSRR